MKTIQMMMEQIETISFEVQFSVISSFKIFKMALERDAVIQELISMLRENPENVQTISERIQGLANDLPEPGVMHSQDIKVVIYLYVLNAASFPGQTLQAIEMILETPGFYWANKYANDIRDNVEARLTDVAS